MYSEHLWIRTCARYLLSVLNLDLTSAVVFDDYYDDVVHQKKQKNVQSACQKYASGKDFSPIFYHLSQKSHNCLNQ